MILIRKNAEEPIIGLLFVSVFVFIMSGQVIEPLKESIARQKRFVTDAGHELKTPVSVIGTNMEILRMDVGTDNEWVESTQRQVTKLRKLISHLISLSKIEEKSEEFHRTPCSFSDAVSDCIEIYEIMAETEGKKLTAKVEENLWVKAEEITFRQMLTVLFENAVKYAKDNSEIEIILRKDEKKAVFMTINEWSHDVKEEDLEKLFDRFYRGDKSRNRNEKNSGFGLGLSIAKTAAEKNKGKIMVYEDKEKRIVFVAEFGLLPLDTAKRDVTSF